MELDMADVLLNGFPIDYKLVSIRLQLKDGGIEIGPPRSFINEDDDGVTNLILQVYNEYAEEVEIEYQPVSKQDDSRWGFWCDGRTLKTVIPYKFWKTYWYPDPVGNEFVKNQNPLQLHNLIRRSAAPPISASQAAICGVNEYNNGANREPSMSSQESASSFLMAGINICQCHSQNNNSNNNNDGGNNKSKRPENSRQVSTGLQPMPVGGLVQSGSARAGSDTRVIKVRCQRSPGSPASSSSQDFELAIKVRCSRPVSPSQVPEPETKMKCSRPASPAQVSETANKTRPLFFTEESETTTKIGHLLSTEASNTTAKTRQSLSIEASETTTKIRQLLPIEIFESATKARQLSSTEVSDRIGESRCATPSSTTAALARAKEALARMQQISENVVKSGPGSSIDSFDRLSESRCPTPLLPTEALTRAKDALVRMHTSRPLRPVPSTPRPAPSTPKLRVPCRSLANTEVYVRAVANPTAISPLLLTPPSPEKRVLIDASVLRKSFSGDTSDLIDSFSRGTDLALEQQRESIVVGQVIVKDVQKLETREVWKAAFEKFISKEKANILKHHEKFDKFISKEKVNIIKHHKKSKEFLKETIEFISREKATILKQGMKYIAAKKKELASTRIECIFCLRVAPPVLDTENNVNWKSLNDVKSWKNTQFDSQQSKISLVTIGTNTGTCTPTNIDGQSPTRF